jgi:hypothetical protein
MALSIKGFTEAAGFPGVEGSTGDAGFMEEFI